MTEETTMPGTTTGARLFRRPRVELTGPAPSTRRHLHGLGMVACCIPMLVIAVALVASGVVSAGFIVFAVLCTAMMALMHKGMGHGGHGGGP